jgi:hypothetical protein
MVDTSPVAGAVADAVRSADDITASNSRGILL